MVTAVVLRLRFRTLPAGQTPTGVRRGAWYVGADLVEVPEADVVSEADGWFTAWPLGRVANPNAWIFARRVAFGSEEAWVWALPSDPVVNRTALRTAYDALVANWPARAWTFAELEADGGAAATAVKAGWLDERARIVTQTGVDGNGRPIYRDDGPDPAADRIAVYRGIGTAGLITKDTAELARGGL